MCTAIKTISSAHVFTIIHRLSMPAAALPLWGGACSMLLHGLLSLRILNKQHMCALRRAGVQPVRHHGDQLCIQSCSVRTPAPGVRSGSFFGKESCWVVTQPLALCGEAELLSTLKGSDPEGFAVVRYLCVWRGGVAA